MTRAIAALGLATLLSLMLAVPAEAYRLIQTNSTGRVTSGDWVFCNDSGGFVHWDRRVTSWLLNPAGQGANKASAIQSALDSWDDVGTIHKPTYGGTTSATWSIDGKNTLYWGTGNGCTSTCLALTGLVLQSGKEIVEVDIMFRSDKSWSPSLYTVAASVTGSEPTATQALKVSGYDTEAVAAHELGHGLGIHHTEVTSSPTPTMDASYFGTGGRSLESDDDAALLCSERKYCDLKGDGAYFAGRSIASLYWGCLDGANVDVFRNGVKVATTSNSGTTTHIHIGQVASANFWVCEAGSTTWYDSETCTNVRTVVFP